jgi:AraC-like DNA-binding protein
VCFGFVPLVIEAIWSQHGELSLQTLTEGLSLTEMTRRPREALLSWLTALAPMLRACPSAVNSAPIDRVIESIRADCSLPYSQANLSRSLGLTPAYFCRLFHEKTGQHFSTFLTRARMEKAQYLLSDARPMTLAEISAACGYPNKSYFCQVFKKYTGMTPGEYEAAYKEV